MQTILSNIESLPLHKEAFVANILANEEKLKADVESLEKAYYSENSKALG